MTDGWQLFSDLVRAETRLFNQLDARVRTGHDGLTLGQFQMLELIATTPDCRVSDIVASMDIGVGTASKAVDRLEAAGLCRRASNPHDRRSSILALTPDGERAFAAATPTVDAVIAERVQGIAADDLATTARVLSRLRTVLEELSR
ncbi:MarR family winged helix-turn-helix transcriptional regulator [Nocardioides sp. CCNWLW239]|uniref:MarR family winged helix-turn-helix transcriptional regulator n=1 Tax=Nocardioides sp. CCNWLW239 TaxID=3128902 RepID=UPI00301AE4F4